MSFSLTTTETSTSASWREIVILERMGDNSPYTCGDGNVFTDQASNINSNGFLGFPSDKQNMEEERGSEIDSGHEISSMSPLSIGFSTEELDVPNEVPPFNRNDLTVACISSVKVGTRSKDKCMAAVEKWVRYNSEDVKMVTDLLKLPKKIIYFFIARHTGPVMLTVVDTDGKLTCGFPDETRKCKEDPGMIYSVFELRLPNKVTTSTFIWASGDKVLQQVQIYTVESQKEDKSTEAKEKNAKKGKTRVVETVRDDSAIDFTQERLRRDINNNIEPTALSKDTNSIGSKSKKNINDVVISRSAWSTNTIVLIPQNVELLQKIDTSLKTEGLGKFDGVLGDQRSFWFREILSQHRNVLIHTYGDTVPTSELSLFLGAATEVLLMIPGDDFTGPLYLIMEVNNDQKLNWTQKGLEKLPRWPSGPKEYKSIGEEAQDIIFQIGHAVKESQNLPVSGLFVDVQNQGIDQQLHRYLRNWLGASQLKEVPSLYFICLEFSSARLSGYTKAHAHQVLDEQIGTDNYNPEGVFNGCVAVCISGTDRLRWLLALQHKQIRDKLIERGLVLESISELCLHDVEQLIVREDNEPYREQLFDMLCRMQGHGIPRYFKPRSRLYHNEQKVNPQEVVRVQETARTTTDIQENLAPSDHCKAMDEITSYSWKLSHNYRPSNEGDTMVLDRLDQWPGKTEPCNVGESLTEIENDISRMEQSTDVVPNELPPFNGGELAIAYIDAAQIEGNYMTAVAEWQRHSEHVKLVTTALAHPSNKTFYFMVRYTDVVYLITDVDGRSIAPQNCKCDAGIIYSVFRLRICSVGPCIFTLMNGDGTELLRQLQVYSIKEKVKSKVLYADSDINSPQTNGKDLDPMRLINMNSIDDGDTLKSKRKRKYDDLKSLPSKSVNTVILVPYNAQLMQKIGRILETDFQMFNGDLGEHRSFWHKNIMSQHRNVLIQAYGDSVPNIDLGVFLEAATEVLLLIEERNFEGPLCLITGVHNTDLIWTQKRLERLQQWPCIVTEFSHIGRTAKVIIQMENIFQQANKAVPISGLFVNTQRLDIDNELGVYLKNWLGSSALQEVSSMYFLCLEFSGARLSSYTKALPHQTLEEQIDPVTCYSDPLNSL